MILRSSSVAATIMHGSRKKQKLPTMNLQRKSGRNNERTHDSTTYVPYSTGTGTWERRPSRREENEERKQNEEQHGGLIVCDARSLPVLAWAAGGGPLAGLPFDGCAKTQRRGEFSTGSEVYSEYTECGFSREENWVSLRCTLETHVIQPM